MSTLLRTPSRWASAAGVARERAPLCRRLPDPGPFLPRRLEQPYVLLVLMSAVAVGSSAPFVASLPRTGGGSAPDLPALPILPTLLGLLLLGLGTGMRTF